MAILQSRRMANYLGCTKRQHLVLNRLVNRVAIKVITVLEFGALSCVAGSLFASPFFVIDTLSEAVLCPAC